MRILPPSSQLPTGRAGVALGTAMAAVGIGLLYADGLAWRRVAHPIPHVHSATPLAVMLLVLGIWLLAGGVAAVIRSGRRRQ